MEINVNFILFDELKEKPDNGGATTRIVVLRDDKSLDLTLEEGATDPNGLE